MVPGASLRPRKFRWGDASKKITGKPKAEAVGRSTHTAAVMSGGKDGSVLSLLCSQTCDLAGDYSVDRGDIVCPGAESDEDASRRWNDAYPICGGSDRSSGGAAVPVGERRRHEEDDGGHDNHANRRCRPRFCRDDGAASSGRGRHGASRTQIRSQRATSPTGAGGRRAPAAGERGK